LRRGQTPLGWAALNERLHIMGILNVTPDSFSDGGKFTTLEACLRQAETMVAEGATILDVGGESTRPGAVPVSADEEKRRVVPVIEAIRSRFPVAVSIDTQKAAVAQSACEAGATIINDVSAGDDPSMAATAVQHGSTVVLMHRQGDSRTMQENPHYPRGVVREVKEFLQQRCATFAAAGVPQDKIWIDPGIGFGKTLEHNLELMKHLREFEGVGHRLLVGTSRKSFLARLLGDASLPMEQREAGTLASNLWALTQGASVFRVHDVGSFSRAVKTWEAMQ